MSICPLPQSTITIIGASQVITDAASLVKELIDNALDARASSILLEISSNALDFIQVRDNGHGVPAIDHDLICKRYCTSKLRSYDDLKNIAAMSLGFRGEALASAAELSGSMLITTRVEGDAAATALSIARNGDVLRCEAALPFSAA
ncbi:hypothetical protein MRB53_037051 [Persea americana]|nr:hypothetical protein MRB53_037051 [Persea americana]